MIALIIMINIYNNLVKQQSGNGEEKTNQAIRKSEKDNFHPGPTNVRVS